MIVYDPLWKTMKEKGISSYALIKEYGVSSSTVSRLRNNKPISTTTLNDLCNYLHCEVNDILKHIPD